MTQPQRPDKKEVLGETFTDEKLALFFDCKPYDDTPADFHILVKAYRGLPVDAFERFIELFISAGKNLQVKNQQGLSFLEIIQTHDHQQMYVDVLKKLSIS